MQMNDFHTEKMTIEEFREHTSEFGKLQNEDLVQLFVPLFKQLTPVHENEQVANLKDLLNLTIQDRSLMFSEESISSPLKNVSRLRKISRKDTGIFEVTEKLKEKIEVGEGTVTVSSKELNESDFSKITHPVYLLNYDTYENQIGHYDQKTELFICGMLLASFAFNLDFKQKDDLERFVNNRKQLYLLNSEIHPTILVVIYQLTELDRTKRTRETLELIWKLENYLDYSADNETDITLAEGFIKNKAETRGTWVLQELKSRLFEISRRNRLLYFKNSTRFLNLTLGSVPTVLFYENIKEDNLFLWNKKISEAIKTQGKVNLSNYLQLGEAGYLSSNLDKIRSEARKDITEFGINQLKVVITFLKWYNFKENKKEKITSPLLLVSVNLVKKKGVKDQFILEFNSSKAEVNPILVHYLKELYDIDLPDHIDLEKVDLKSFYERLSVLISGKNKEINLSLLEKPRIKLIQSIAKQKLSQYKRKNRYKAQEFNVSSFSYSYKRNNYNPLGCQIYKDHIKPRSSYLEYLINDDIKLESNAFSITKTKDVFSLDESQEINPYNWEFDICNMTLGNFNYKKMSLVGDYSNILSQKTQNKVFDELFSDAPKKLSSEDASLTSFEENFYVLNADATQGSAISKAKTGNNLIIQGPPGTGKSQTITNLIADFASRGKKILFVCEKRAALDVVYARLKQNNLHHLASLIHDSQADKKEFILDAKATYEKFIDEKGVFDEIKKSREQKVQDIKKEIEKINQFHRVMKSAHEQIGISFIDFIEQLLVLRNTELDINTTYNNKPLQALNFKNWKKAEGVLNEFSKALTSVGLNENIGAFSLKRIHKELSENKFSVNEISNLISSLKNLTTEWIEIADIYDFEHQLQDNLIKFKVFCQSSFLLLNLTKKGKQNVIEPGSHFADEFDKLQKNVSDLSNELSSLKAQNKNWKSKLSLQETEQALEVAKKFEDKFYSFIIPSFNRIKKVLKEAYDFKQHKIEPKITTVLDQLKDEHKTKELLGKIENSISEEYGISGTKTEKETINFLRKSEEQKSSLLAQNEESLKTLSEINKELHNITKDLQILDINLEHESVNSLDNKLSRMQNDIKTLPVLMPHIEAFSNLSNKVKDIILSNELPLKTNELLIAENVLQKLYNENINVVKTTGHALKYSISKIQQLHKELLSTNGDYLIEKYKSTFKQELLNSTLYAKQQTKEEVQKKKTFLKSRKILENEFKKSIRYKSIRDLKSSEASYILDIIKPIWLMSPLSVSDTLPVDSNLFDLVIFDEASQITLEEGVPTLFRSNQAIIVGDEMQMPPTKFFSSSSSDKSEIEEQDHEEQMVIDADSMLTHASKKLDDVMLSWHYRSKYESLIGFSNAAFYSGDLLTIPDQEIKTPNNEYENNIIDSLKHETISFHYLEEGIYSNRKNNYEASYIAEMLKKLLTERPELSIGVVAFSMEQQENIENAVDKLASTDPKFSEILENAYNKTEDGQSIGLFVKNLENVQGDERDIIIISICYGYNETGKMRMNFGPINKKGGEKRLNVIFSRSKQHMAIVSSIKYLDIKNEYNEGANYLRQFLQYAESVSKGEDSLTENILKNLSPELASNRGASIKTDIVKQEICGFIRAQGFDIDEDLGLSKFKISIVVKDPKNPSKYILGILLDSTDFYSHTDTFDQYVLRPGLLTAFDWKNITVFKKDWLDRPDLVKTQIENALNENESALDLNQFKRPHIEEVNTNSITTQNVKQEKSTKNTTQTVNTTLLEFKDANSNKFWQVTQEETELAIQFGKIGSKGRLLKKSFENVQEASLERKKMIDDKLKKGYLKM